MINEQRITDEFKELVSIDSPTFGERKMADRLKQKLAELGFDFSEDGAGAKCGSTAGNIHGFLKGTVPGEPILLAAHMDTVSPAVGKKAVEHEDGTITSDGTTVLGADDAAGLCSIFEAVRSLKEDGEDFRDVEILFPVSEEEYTAGTKAFDFSVIKARQAYVLDLSGEPGTAALRAPTLIAYTVTILGKAAHAGFCPEEGINALQAAAAAIVRIRQGHVDEQSVLNIGRIEGGTATNIVPDKVVIRGELRSFSHERALELMTQTEKIFAEESEKLGARAETESFVSIKAYNVPVDAPVVRRFSQACEKLGIEPKLTQTLGGSDNNNFAKNGISGIVISCGMNNCHSVTEFTTRRQLAASAEIVREILKSRL